MLIARRLLLLLCLLHLVLSISFAQDMDEADTLMQDGKYAEAAAAYQAVFDATQDASALYKMANAKTRQAERSTGDEAIALYDEAVAKAKEAVALEPNDDEAHMALARAWGRLAQFRGILESLNLAKLVRNELDSALAINPNNDDALHALALWYLNVPWIFGGNPDKLRPNFDQAIAIRPTVRHHMEYGEALLQLGDKEAAKVQLEKALGLEPQDADEQDAQTKAKQLLASHFP